MLGSKKMDVHIASQWESLIQEKLREGVFRSADEVVDEAMRLLAQRDALLTDDGTWAAKIEAGWQAAQRGDVVDGAELFAEVERELDAGSRTVS
ncbi:MAG: type II toxin-antitoxin system ParD family antitoxin [Acidobacteriota bacterium]